MVALCVCVCVLQVLAERDSLPVEHRPPLLVKISPDLAPTEREDIAACVTRPHPHRNPDGLIVANTTMSRPETLRSGHRSERGGLSGAPLRDTSTEAVRDMYRLTKGTIEASYRPPPPPPPPLSGTTVVCQSSTKNILGSLICGKGGCVYRHHLLCHTM